MKRHLFALLAAPLLGGAFLTATAVSAQGACPVDSSFTEVNNAVPATIDGNIQLRTDYYDCGTYIIVSSRKWDQFSGPAVRGYYNANITYYSGSTWRYKRTGMSFGENVWINMVDFSCYKPCTMVHTQGSNTDVISWPDGTMAVGSDTLE